MRVERAAASLALPSAAKRTTEPSAAARSWMDRGGSTRVSGSASAEHIVVQVAPGAQDSSGLSEWRQEVDPFDPRMQRLLVLLFDRDADGWTNDNDLPVDIKRLLHAARRGTSADVDLAL